MKFKKTVNNAMAVIISLLIGICNAHLTIKAYPYSVNEKTGTLRVHDGIYQISKNDIKIEDKNQNKINFIDFNEVKIIQDDTFSNFFSLKSVKGYHVNTIGKRAFYQCEALSSVDFPDVVRIGEHGFYRCSELTAVDIPSISILEKEAFTKCTHLEKINLTDSYYRLSLWPHGISTDAFIGCSKLKKIGASRAMIINFENGSGLNSLISF